MASKIALLKRFVSLLYFSPINLWYLSKFSSTLSKNHVLCSFSDTRFKAFCPKKIESFMFLRKCILFANSISKPIIPKVVLRPMRAIPSAKVSFVIFEIFVFKFGSFKLKILYLFSISSEMTPPFLSINFFTFL